MASFSALETAKRGILAQKFGFDVTNNNIQNINTPGYSRRSAVFTETPPLRSTSGAYVGTGVASHSLRTYREELFDKDVRTAMGRQSSFTAEQSIYERLEALLSEPSDNGIGESVNSLFASFEQAANNPENLNLRNHILQNAKTLVKNLHYTAGSFATARQDIYRDTQNNIESTNQLLEQIAGLNKKIGQTKAETGIEAQTFVDQREIALEKLSKLTGSHIMHEKNGQVNVFIDGINVVTSEHFSKLRLAENTNATTGEVTLSILKTDPNGVQNGSVAPISGELSAQLKGYNVIFDPKDSSGEYSAYTKINEYVNTLATKINALTTTGFGLNDPAGPAPARNFFLPATGPITAENIQLNPALENNPADIPLASVTGEAGNNTIGRAIARLANDTTFLNGYSPSGAYSSILGKVGMMSQEAIGGSKTMKMVVQQLESQRESLIGVNLDEEAVNIVKYQRAFEASSRVVNTTNELLQTIINLAR